MTLLGDEEVRPHVAQQRFGEERDRIEASLTAWNLRVPKLRAGLFLPSLWNAASGSIRRCSRW